MGEALKLTWDESLSSGVRAIDVQHKYLFEIINEIAEAIESGHGGMSVGRILNLMKYYAGWHFGREELCMERFRCPAEEGNQKAHAYFLEMVAGFEKEYRQSGGSEDIARRIYAELTAWLVNHIKGVDGKLAARTRRRNEGCS